MKNKKLFAILTLVCFMFTLMPVAAFAAESDLSATASVFATVDSNVDALKGETVDAQISLKNVGGNAYASDKDETVYVWAETVAGQPNDAFEVSKGAADKGNKGVYSVKVKSIKDLTIKFYRAGNYTLKASFQNPLTTKNVEDVVLFAGAADSYKTVNVEGTAPDTAYWGVNVKATGVDEFLTDGEETNKALVVKVDDTHLVPKVCYEIGNRHATLFEGSSHNEFITIYSEPMKEMLEKIGANVTVEEIQFDFNKSISASINAHQH